jgi:predicted Abi (CAAX) family protease
MDRVSRSGRLTRLLTRLPSKADGLELLLALVVFGAFASVVGRDLLVFALAPPSTLISVAVMALVTPAILEEFVFRGVLIPEGSVRTRWPALLVSTALFTVWHVLESLTFLPGARMLFLRGDFLVLAAILGLFCGLLRLRSGGLWTAIVLHWLVVVIWKAALSGPSLADLTDFASP